MKCYYCKNETDGKLIFNKKKVCMKCLYDNKKLEEEYDNHKSEVLFNNIDKVCVLCYQKINHFRNKISKKEFTVFQLCQLCQDKVFN